MSTVHKFIPDWPGASRGRVACANYPLWTMKNNESEVQTPLGDIIEIQGGINHKVTCKRCLQSIKK